MEYDKELIDDMMAMGMQEAFTPSADFSGMADEDLFISLLQQFTYVKVNEEGTEAAAVTVGGMDVAAPRTKYGNSFYVDRPFIFLIKEKSTGVILFMGKVTKHNFKYIGNRKSCQLQTALSIYNSALVYLCHCLLILVFQLQEVCLALIDNRYFNEVFNHTDLSSHCLSVKKGLAVDGRCARIPPWKRTGSWPLHRVATRQSWLARRSPFGSQC